MDKQSLKGWFMGLIEEFRIMTKTEKWCPPLEEKEQEFIRQIYRLIENGPAVDKLRITLESMVHQFAYVGQDENGPTLWTGGLSALEEAFEVLGWGTSKPIPERKCQAEGCKKEATCGTPTKDGYKRLCYKHYEEINPIERVK